jgi:hypothetical protein
MKTIDRVSSGGKVATGGPDGQPRYARRQETNAAHRRIRIRSVRTDKTAWRDVFFTVGSMRNPIASKLSIAPKAFLSTVMSISAAAVVGGGCLGKEDRTAQVP